ncbi:hypothetical protein VTJ83DRAFT_348 [Remersonia thermophila]|uniref:Uncharacterized protein n=1 Tax=Remersonia thermophila TaxID=72144 RepID=A0ABR4DME4_9PEZI
MSLARRRREHGSGSVELAFNLIVNDRLRQPAAMAGHSDREAEFLQGAARNTEGKDKNPTASIRSPRCFTHKTLFTNLDEAHQAITSKTAPPSTGDQHHDASTAPSSSLPSSLHVCGLSDQVETSTDSLSRDVQISASERLQSALRHGQGSDTLAGTHTANAVMVRRQPTSPIHCAVSSPQLYSSQNANPIEGSFELRYPDEVRLQSRPSAANKNPQSLQPSTTTQHLNDAYDESLVNFSYPTHSSRSVRSSREPSASSQHDNSQSDHGRHGSTVCSPAYNSGSASATYGYNSLTTSATCTNPTESANDSTTSEVVASGQPTPPLESKVPADRAFKGSPISCTNIYVVDNASDSDEDPFYYDRSPVSGYPLPAREREVSAALHSFCVDSTSSPAPSLHQLQGTTSPRRIIPGDGSFSSDLYHLPERVNPPCADDDWDEQEDGRGIRITVVRPLAATVPSSEIRKENLGIGDRRNEQNQRLRDQTITLTSDWETVNSIPNFDSTQAIASSSRLSDSQQINYAGSSIADVSDTSSFHVPRFEEATSKDRIIPGFSTTCNQTYPRHPATLKRTDGPVFLPKPRIHRVNGYLQNSNRLFTDTSNSSSHQSFRSTFVDKITSSIRERFAKKRAQRQGEFSGEQTWRGSKLGSVDSFIHSPNTKEVRVVQTNNGHGGHYIAPLSQNDHEPADSDDGGRDRQQSYMSGPGPRISLTLRAPPPAHLKENTQLTGPVSMVSGTAASPTLFSFPLISLEEAKKREALRKQLDSDYPNIHTSRTRNNSTVKAPMPVAQGYCPPTPMSAVRRSSLSIFGIPCSDQADHEEPVNAYPTGRSRGISSTTSRWPGETQSILSRSFCTPMRVSTTGHASMRTTVFSTPPRLVPRDDMRRRRMIHPSVAGGIPIHSVRNTSFLRDGLTVAEPFTITAPLTSTTAPANAHLSWQARRRRDMCLRMIYLAAIVPFCSLAAYCGGCDWALDKATHGEVSRLSRTQRRRAGIIGLVSCLVVVFVGTVLVVAWAVANGRAKGLGM